MATFRITPLYGGVPQPDEARIVQTDDPEEIEMYRTGWTADGTGQPVQITVMADEIEDEEDEEDA